MRLNTSKQGIIKTTNVGWFNQVEIDFLLSKIEENNRRLEVSEDSLTSYVSTLNSFNHQTYSLGLDLQAFTFDWPTLKFKLDLLVGFRYGRVLLSDSSSVSHHEFGVNTTAFIPSARIQLFSEERFSLLSEVGWNFYRIRDQSVSQIDELGKKILKNIFFY